MPLDPNIILQIGKGVTPLKDQSEINDEAAVRQMRQLQLQQAQQGVTDDQAYRAALSSGATGDALVGDLQKRGLGKQAMEYQKFQTEQQKAQGERGKLVAEGMKNGANMILANPTEQNAIETLTMAQQQYGLPQQMVDGAKAKIYAARNDPNALKQLAAGWGADAEKVLGKFTSVNMGATQEQQRVNPVTGQLEVAGVQQRTQSPDSIASTAQSETNSLRTDARARELAALKGQELAQNKQLAADAKNLDRVDKKVTAFATQLDKTNVPQFESLLGDIEADIAKFKDIPGYGGIMGNLPTFLQSEEGRALRQKIATLRNLTLKDRSGAAVTNQELTRLLEELGTGYFKTDADLTRGLGGVRKNLDAVKQNVVAGIDDDTLAEYQKRGGIALKRGAQAPADTGTKAKSKPMNIGGKDYMAELAPDGKYYVQQNGKWFEVR